jgi:acyl phosphate:glycerol-3-phosphate acyltransferase
MPQRHTTAKSGCTTPLWDENPRHNRTKDCPNDFDPDCYQLPNRFDTERLSGHKFPGNRHSPTREQEYRSNKRSAGNGEEMGLSGFFCDAFKGFLAVRLAIFLGSLGGIESAIAGVVAAIACILGRNYTFWLGFKGGKGVATSGGVVLALFPWFIVLIVALVWAVVFYLSKYVSLASICAAISLPVSLASMSPWASSNNSWVLILFSVLAAGLAVWRHRTNITRLLNGTESRFAKKKSEGL